MMVSHSKRVGKRRSKWLVNNHQSKKKKIRLQKGTNERGRRPRDKRKNQTSHLVGWLLHHLVWFTTRGYLKNYIKTTYGQYLHGPNNALHKFFSWKSRWYLVGNRFLHGLQVNSTGESLALEWRFRSASVPLYMQTLQSVFGARALFPFPHGG